MLVPPFLGWFPPFFFLNSMDLFEWISCHRTRGWGSSSLFSSSVLAGVVAQNCCDDLSFSMFGMKYIWSRLFISRATTSRKP